MPSSCRDRSEQVRETSNLFYVSILKIAWTEWLTVTSKLAKKERSHGGIEATQRLYATEEDCVEEMLREDVEVPFSHKD